ncbi:MAG: stage II sporulation protein R, partial [Firmicutes bacterium]|nr:stage II sporulation protein R [Bacillota bacterium]
ETKDEALKILYNKIPEIETISENTLKSEGMNYPVNAVLVKEVFPLKYYGAFCFPAGSYTALKVSIGEAKGKNWWCVLFPPLCLTDETFYNEGYEILSKTLSEKDLEIIDYSENEKKSKVNIKFFVVEKWQELLT